MIIYDILQWLWIHQLVLWVGFIPYLIITGMLDILAAKKRKSQ